MSKMVADGWASLAAAGAFAGEWLPATVAAVVLLLVVVAVLVGIQLVLRRQPRLPVSGQRATYEALRLATLAVEPLRDGLTQSAAGRTLGHLTHLLGVPTAAIVDAAGVLAWHGPGEEPHGRQVAARAAAVLGDAESARLTADEIGCESADCEIRAGVVVPVETGGGTLALLVVLTAEEPSGALVRATVDIGRWVSAPLAASEVDNRARELALAEVRALRAQISPHFIYNALSAIASFIRTDPERARELIEEFAEFTRYSFRSHGEFTTLAEELRSIDRYLLIEQARFGDRLRVRLRIAPEVLPVAVPFLCLQPLVENAIRHGLSTKAGAGTITLAAVDVGSDCLLSVEDDGVGMRPGVFTAPEAAGDIGQHVGMANVDHRLRSVFGDEYGLVVETAPGAGTKVSMRVPKFHPGVHARDTPTG